ncbi:limonene-1,2-epoxide hydrolase family protein [Mycobacterium vicinigordonae]|uniref:Nuclear transport factor 2 family protein n=1 Tax=Mycobacterium vicinigordonae TaxID=1719132 RepID=A0A7D6HQH1_9MYCO|nr:limonene-1,2-epoxide hydrolase family protein [Mycobacterium vicinigordonae]QLL07631.1 nuclear transport factor 2 family protein [Mycobacterium vicinigordonae]
MTESAIDTEPDTVVREFCKLWLTGDIDAIVESFTEDAIYHNIPMPVLTGRAEIRDFIAGFLASFDGVDFVIHRQLSQDGVVMNERTDVLRRKDADDVPLPVMGVFEVRGGKIAAWRDYFDLATVTAAFSQ